MKKSGFIFSVLMITACSQLRTHDYTRLADPMIGTGGHGHTYPGASWPFGMVQLSPDTRKDSWDACSGYHYSDSTIFGFSHTHLSGTGVGDYGDIRIMPTIGPLNPNPGEENVPGSGYLSRFHHDREKAEPGFYEVFLDDYNVLARMTVTRRCGFHQYIFPEASRANFIIDLTESVTSDEILELSIDISQTQVVSGFRRTKGWAADQAVYFYAVFSKPLNDAGIFADGTFQVSKTTASGKDLKAYVSFQTTEGESVMVKVGISAVSVDNARKNLEAEIKDWDFDAARALAKEAWNNELSKIEISGGTHEQRVAFYTALYHAFLSPNLFTDVDGSYRGHDGKIYKARDYETYTVFSLWDTYRALHPLMTLIQPEKTNDFIRTMLDIHEKGGLLPVWELAGNETFCMIGYHAVPVIADAMIKGFRGFDMNKALDAMKHSASQDHFGMKAYRDYGFIPAESEGESVSKTLEYAYDDWCIAQTAKLLKNDSDYRTYLQRAQYYKNLFDPDSRFIRGKRNGMFAEPFDPAEVNFMLTEANTWQYTFYVPQDVSGLISFMGGDKGFSDKLDEMFSSSSHLSGRQQSDITGLIGQYAHGNEPSHHMAYLYNYAGQAFKTQAMVRRIMDELYGTGPDGLCGNEDCGQMSAWYVLSAMGFYPVTPGSDIYAIGSPLFDEVKIHLSNGKTFTISADNNSKKNVYIQLSEMNGKPFGKSFITHGQILKGGELDFEMGPVPNELWANAPEDRPVSAITEHLITPVPFFDANSATFKDRLHIAIRSIDPDSDIYYLTGDTASGKGYSNYIEPITLTESGHFTAWALSPGRTASQKVSTKFHKIHHGRTVEIRHPYSPQYTAGGDMALADGQMGGTNFRTGPWQGYHGVDLEVTVDLGRVESFRSVGIRFLEDQRSWIFLPLEVRILTAVDPAVFKTLDTFTNDGPEENDQARVKTYTSRKAGEARYIRILAKNRGVCPPWHPGSGHKAWIFSDEITIK